MTTPPTLDADARNLPPKRVPAPSFGSFLTLANLLLNVPAMVTTFQIQTGQYSGNNARLDWVHVDSTDHGVAIQPPQRFGRGLRVRLRPVADSELSRRSHHTSGINPSVHA